MKLLLLLFCWPWPSIAMSQVKDTAARSNSASAKVSVLKPEILTSGFIDIVNNGQINASARFIRLYIGEPGKFAIPFSMYSGVSSNNFQNQQVQGGQRSNEHLISSFINPLSGLANMSVDGIVFFNHNEDKVTRAGFLYHAGIRVLTGYKTGLVTNPSIGKPINFLNNARNVGIFWLAARYIFSKSGQKQLTDILPAIRTNGLYHGWSAAWGVEINSLVNIKVVYYKYVKRPEIDYSLPIYQFSFNYSLR
jgi:hypothetical protein